MSYRQLSSLPGQRYVINRITRDHDEALRYAELLVAASPPDDRAQELYCLSLILKDRYRLFGDARALDTAIEHTESALVFMHQGDPSLSDMFYDLSDHFFTRYQQLKSRRDLDEAIEYAEKTMAELDYDDPRRVADTGAVVDTLRQYFLVRYIAFNDEADLQSSLIYAIRAFELTSEGHPDRCLRLDQLSSVYARLHSRFQRPSDLKLWMAYADESLTTPGDDSDFEHAMFSLSRAITRRYIAHGETDDLERAVKYAEKAVTTSDGGIQHGVKLTQLSTSLRLRFLRLGAPADAEVAAETCAAAICHNQAALLDPVVARNDKNRLQLLTILSSELCTRSEQPGGSLSDLEQSIKYSQQALNESPSDTKSLNQLAHCFRLRYLRLQALEDLETAIHHAERMVAISLAQPQSEPEQQIVADAFFSLSLGLDFRYQRLGAQSDNNASIRHAESSVTAAPVSSTIHGRLLRHLSRLLTLRYHRDRVPAELTAIIELAEEAVIATAAHDFALPAALTTLAMNLRYRYYLHANIDDIDAAVKHTRAALELVPDGHMDRRAQLCNLRSILRARYPASHNIGDLDEAVELTRQMVAGLPRDHFDRHNLLTVAGAVLQDRFNATGSVSDREQAYSLLLAATNHSRASPLLRVVRAREIIAGFRSLQTPDESSSLLEDAILLIPKISLRFFGREDLQYLLSKLNGLPSDAASFALEAGRDASHALKLLELGRGIIASFGIDSRSELTDLKETHPDLFRSFTSLRTVMNSTEGTPLTDADDCLIYNSNIHFSSKRMQATLDIEPVLDQIRQIPAYQGFLLPSAPAGFMKTAKGGTIVIVNTTELRSDAIIVTSSAIKSIPLLKLVHLDAKEQMQQMPQILRRKRSTFPGRTKQMGQLLAWLWDVVVEPVLLELQPNGLAPGAILPRVWWIGAGVLGKAPFHAAGRDHSAQSTSNTLNRVLSSYIQTIKALGYAQQRELQLVGGSDARLLLVGMPTTPGKAPLPGVQKELTEIADILRKGGMTRTTVLTQPDSSTVLHHLLFSGAVHFACHGMADSTNPSNSSLLLLKRTTPAIIDHLTAEMVSRADTKHAQVAYLSACSTADNAADSLRDETIHLASAFQLAGFNHVVATMWVSNDAACLEVAKDFYRFLFDGSGDGGHRKVSMALHLATKRLRDRMPDQFLIWGPYIHTGA